MRTTAIPRSTSTDAIRSAASGLAERWETSGVNEAVPDAAAEGVVMSSVPAEVEAPRRRSHYAQCRGRKTTARAYRAVLTEHQPGALRKRALALAQSPEYVGDGMRREVAKLARIEEAPVADGTRLEP